MLNDNALSQLKNLKQQIEAQKESVSGVIKGTQRRFGFIVLEDGREIYINPEEMQKVFPGDKVKATAINDGENKPTATIDKVSKSPLQELVGTYIVKGKGHFIQPDIPGFSRWIFIPPKHRGDAQAGDLIKGKIIRHAFPHGKPQAAITQVFGSPDQSSIQARYIAAKHRLDTDLPQDWEKDLQPDGSADTRLDLTDLPFITIDNEDTADIDDAIYLDEQADHLTLYIAIADPTAIIKSGSSLEKAASERISSIYFAGNPQHMLPNELALDRCALIAGKDRLAMTCRAKLSSAGELIDFDIVESTIRVTEKVSYTQANKILAGELHDHDHAELIVKLDQITKELLAQRRENNIVIPNKPEYQLNLDAQGKIETIDQYTKTAAHRIVEEAMIIANRCAAKLLDQEGLFISHPGFRKERAADVAKLCQEQLSMEVEDQLTFTGYKNIMKAVETFDGEFPLRSVLSRMLSRSELSAKIAPHFGMSFKTYTSFTSPLRKFTDFRTHQLIKNILKDQPQKPPSNRLLNDLQDGLSRVRFASNEYQRWLYCQYVSDKVGRCFDGHIAQINSRGFTVQIDESGIQANIETKSLGEKFSFDPMRMTLKSATRSFQLEQAVSVEIKEVNSESRIITISLA